MSLRILLAGLLGSALFVFGCGGTKVEEEPDGCVPDGADCEPDPPSVCGFDSIASNAFRADAISIDAPGLFLNSAGTDGGVTCASDLTTLANNLINTAVCTDAADDEDALLDLSLILSFDSFSTEGAPGSFGPGVCADPSPGTNVACEPDSEIEPNAVTLTVSGGDDCTQTLGSQTVSATFGTDGCFSGAVDGGELLLNLGTVSIPVVAASMAGSFVGSPATAITDGALLGFVTLEAAENTTLPADLPPPIGGSPLIDLLRGPACDPTDLETVDLGGELGETQGFVFVLGVDMIGVPFEAFAPADAG